MAPGMLEQLLLQLMGISQVTVMRQGDAKGGIHIERLRLGGAGAAGGGIAHMPYPHISL